MKKTWLNSKAPPPDTVIWFLVVSIVFIVLLTFSGGDVEVALWVSFALVVIVWIIITFFSGRDEELIKKIGQKRFDEVKNNITLINIIQCDLLNVCGGKHSRAHLAPKNINYTGTVEAYWGIDKKQMKYQVSYKDGQEDGKWRGWYKNGQLGYEKCYKVFGERHFRLGKAHGKTKVWDKSSKLLAELDYKEGKLVWTKTK